MANVDRISELYRGELGAPKLQQRELSRIDWLTAGARGEVLDLGCSQGIAAILCARRGLRAVGVDIDPARIAEARADRERKPPAVRELLDFRVGDAQRLELADNSFDSALLGNVLEWVDDLDAVLAEVARVTRPDGVIAITVPFGFDPERGQVRSFYVASLVDALASHLSVDSLDVVDRYLRVMATPGAMAEDSKGRLIVELQPLLEEVLTDVDTDLARARDRRRRLARAVRRLDRVARRSRRRVATMRRTRWWRFGMALSAARRPRGLIALPRALVRATRWLPPPAKGRPESWRRRPPPVGPRPTVHAELVAGAADLLEVEIPSVELPDGPVAREDLTVAVILDRFSASAFRYEWHQVEFGPDDWRETLERERPDLLFVESAWRGNDGRWFELLKGSRAQRGPLSELAAWCRERGIPTVFWNKEDPPNFSHFVRTADLFDHVFTVDGGCISRYAEALGREQVGVLQFGAQPRIHNPIAVPGGRAHDVVFAGTYFPYKHPERRRQMETILAPAREFGLHIYSRIIPGADERFEWPPEYRPHIVGSLPYERMLAAYKAYRVFLNVNSVTESPTMCARRVFELSACSTPVLSGYSRAIGEVFGDLVPIARTPDQTRAQLAEMLGDAELREHRAHLALREVLARHTYGHRVDQVLRTVGLPVAERAPSVSVLLLLDSPDDVPHALAQVAGQAWRPLQLVAVVRAPEVEGVNERARAAGIEDAVVISERSLGAGACLNLALDAAGGDVVCVFDPGARYEDHYLTDLVQAFSYTDASIVGKRAHYGAAAGDVAELHHPEAEHVYTDELHPATLAVSGELLRRLRFDPDSEEPELDLVRRALAASERAYSADRFSFAAAPRVGSRA